MITHFYNPNENPQKLTNFKTNENQNFESNNSASSMFDMEEEKDEMTTEEYVNNKNPEYQQKTVKFSFNFDSEEEKDEKLVAGKPMKGSSQIIIKDILSNVLDKSKSLKQKKMKKLRKSNLCQIE